MNKLLHSLAWYAREYRLTYPTIKGAKKHGLSLDNPAELLSQLLARKTSKMGDLAHLQDLVDGRSHEPKPTPKPLKKLPASKSGLSREVARLEAEVEESHAAYRAETRPLDKANLHRIYLANVAALRQMAKEAPKADRAAENVLQVDDVVSVWSRCIKEFRVTLEAIPIRLATHPLFRKLDPVEVETLLQVEVGAALERLHRGPWLSGEEEAK